MAQPWKHPQTGVFYLRRQIPEALRPWFGGRALKKVSLRTKDPREASRVFATENALFEQELGTARKALADLQAASTITPERADELVRAFLTEDRLPVAERHRDDGLTASGRAAFAMLDMQRVVARRVKELAADEEAAAPSGVGDEHDTPRNFKPHMQVVDELTAAALGAAEIVQDAELLKMPLTALKRRAGITQIAGATNDRVLLAALARHLQDRSIYKLPSADPEPSRQPRAKARVTLEQAFENWKRQRTPPKQTADEYKLAVDRFVSLHGNKPIQDITEDDVLDFRDAVAKLPARLPNADRSKSMTAVLAAYDGKDAPRLSPGSIEKNVGALRAILGVAKQDRYVAANVAAGIVVEGSRRPQTPRAPFSDEQMAVIFSSPLFTGCAGQRLGLRHKPGSHVFKDSLYWLFVLAACMGARIEEIGQALVTDLVKQAGFYVLALNDWDDEKGVKTDGSVRRVPVHPMLIKLGFIRFVEERRAAHATHIFDVEQNDFGKWTKELSRDANRYLDRIGLDSPYLSFHSFRHKFKDMCRDNGISMEIHDQLTGHTDGAVGRKYGHGASIETLNKAVCRLKFSFLRPLLPLGS